MSDLAPPLRLTRWINASPQRVFEAWTDPEQLARWLSPSAEVPLAKVEVDAAIGGAFRLAYGVAGAAYHNTVVGRYLELQPPSRLKFTWAWQSPHSEFDECFLNRDSTVTLDFTAIDGGTQLTLLHEGLPVGGIAERHGWGWGGALDQLVVFGFNPR